MVPIFWGIMGFLTFTAPQNAWADMFWDTVHRTCPPWLITGPTIFANSLATPVLNAALYGGVALGVAFVFDGVAVVIHRPLVVGPRRAYGLIALVGLSVVVAAIFSNGPWALTALPDAAWITIGSAVIYFSISVPVFVDDRWPANVAIVFRRYAVRFGVPAGVVIGALPLIYGVTWSVEWEILLVRLAIWLVICGGVAFGVGWLLHVTFRRGE
jgi:hypothetical protein